MEENRCWKGYEPVPNKKPYSKGSCRKEAMPLNIQDPAVVTFLRSQLAEMLESSTAMPDLWHRPRDWK